MKNAIKVAVVDDLPQDRETIRSLIVNYAKERDYYWQVDLYPSGETFLKSLSQNHYTVVFLDILMDEIDGMETARQLRKTDPETLLVFVTTEADYAIEGYEVEAAGFLIKEEVHQKRRFTRLMDRLEHRLQPDTVLEFLDNTPPLRLPAGEVLYAEVLDHNLLLHVRDGTHVLRKTIEEIKSMLPQDGRFFECHRGIVINLDAVSSLGGQVVTMEDGSILPVSRRKRSELEQSYAARNIAKVRRSL